MGYHVFALRKAEYTTDETNDTVPFWPTDSGHYSEGLADGRYRSSLGREGSFCFALSYSEAREFYDLLCQSVFNMTFVQVMNDPQLSDLSPLYPLLNHGITDGFGPQHCKRLMQEMRELRKAVFNSDPIQALADDEHLWFFNMYDRYLKAFEFGSDDGTVSICG